MDPLSIASGVIAVLTASGNTVQGLEKIWDLRHRSVEFVGLWNQVNGVRALLWGTEIALRNIKDDEQRTPRVQDCLSNIDELVSQAIQVFAVLDKAIRDVDSKNGNGATKKPSKRSWLRRKSKLTHLTSQVSILVVSLNAALSILQGVQSSVAAGQTALKIDLVLSKVEALAARPPEISPVPPLDVQYAAIKGQNEIYECLLYEKADPFFRDQSGMMAVQPGIDRALSGSDLDRNASGTALTSSGLFKTSENLDQQGFTLLHLIVLELQYLDLEMVLKYYPIDIDAPDANGRTPLLWAAWRGDVASVSLLLKYGAGVDKIDDQLWTPLAKACKAGHIGAAQCLLEADASVTIATLQGFQPIHHASDNKPSGARIVQELLSRGADPNAYSKAYGTPLHNAANRGSVDSIRCLLANGSDINAVDGDGDTPSMVALCCWNEPAFFHLVKSGSRLDIARTSGHNVVHFAVWFASVNVWDLLMSYADIGKLHNLDLRVLHNGHDISACFEQCRALRFPGKRDLDKEAPMFRRMMQAFGIQATP
ncbi:hypothetical protein N0V83_006579 [Neocucurbitaria cava]|uniref:Ankyrin repeat protein n=1 Tax=Neocucurbitaria cava TaxID=798079 RepID=A0A9W9CLD7_9PLEO|nr:hypothetical protein N0V83_006579 [Neocucurbitaria cava]